MSSAEVKQPASDRASAAAAAMQMDKVTYHFCDLMPNMCNAWEDEFKSYIPERVKVHRGDIFKDGPAADAIVSPANSFGFMDGGIDYAYSQHFGWQMQERLQKLIREKHHGEILVGEAVIIPAFDGWVKDSSVDMSKYNEGQPIKWLISAPTMRVPMDVHETANAYLAFRAVILAVAKHNATSGKDPIRSVLCPGLGTAVGRMPATRCAHQMVQAFETFDLGVHQERISPKHLEHMWMDHVAFTEMLIAFQTFDLGLKQDSLHPKHLKDVLSAHFHLSHYGSDTKTTMTKSQKAEDDPPKSLEKASIVSLFTTAEDEK